MTTPRTVINVPFSLPREQVGPAPQRIQLRRTKGWRKPEGAVVVSRPSKWGNPFQLRHDDIVGTHVRCTTPAEVVELFRLTLLDPTPGMRLAYPSRGGRFVRFTVEEIRAELAGRDLACWCPLDQPCHADVLLELANQETP